MATRVETFDIETPAGTLDTAPITTALPYLRARLDQLEILVPPGPSGLVGFRLNHSGTQVIPRRAGQWLITDDEVIRWPLSRFPEAGRWELTAYNTDVYPHTLYLRFLVTDWAPAELPGVIPVPIPATSATPAELAESGGPGSSSPPTEQLPELPPDAEPEPVAGPIEPDPFGPWSEKQPPQYVPSPRT